MLRIITIEVSPFSQNARILYEDQNAAISIVDPGADVSRILDAVGHLQPRSLNIFLTHAHIDHGGGVERTRKLASERFGLEVLLYAHADGSLRKSIAQQALLFGLSPAEYANVSEPDVVLNEGDTFEIGSVRASVLWTPGHAPDHLSLYIDVASVEIDGRAWSDTPVVIAGDTLFSGSIGRTDLPGGSFPTLISSIREKLLTLPDATLVLSGHGPDTSIGQERLTNPFLVG